MSPASFFLFCFLSQLPLLTSTAAEENSTCQPFDCGKLGKIKFPFTKTKSPKCGLCFIDGCDEDNQKIKLGKEEKENWYEVKSISQANNIVIIDQEFQKLLNLRKCEIFKNLTLLDTPFIDIQISHNQTFFKCNSSSGLNTTVPDYFNYTGCGNTSVYFSHTNHTSPQKFLPQCSIIQLPLGKNWNSNDPFALLTDEISLDLKVFPDCHHCVLRGGKCEIGSRGEFHCACHVEKGKNRLRLKLALGIGCPAILLICLLFYFRCCYKQKYAASNLLSRHISSDPSSKSDLERGNVYFGVPIFSYSELEEATNNFDQAKELGDGGFGAVYHGKLQDGREVAVKRLYEHNYRRVEQFMNEVQILTRLHHKNLVTLYGCTSPRNRELLLVYEFIPNGTVADHLHSDGPKCGSLTWPIRMSIAIETATALAYLHASKIVHRDVKTTNILLDSNYCVKVADFGLSRLFPTDITHVSTAPQGTPGYVDPEYHQCYQLTSKSDVYSFGVVLIELISSMPAVDISRHRYEINLANLAINKIHKRAFDELVDPRLRFESDLEIKRMVMLVAELAYQCLQQDKELRPSMDEVLETLKNIQMGNYEWENSTEEDDETGELKSAQPPPSSDCDEVGLLKNRAAPPSPDSVTGKWLSVSTTPNASG